MYKWYILYEVIINRAKITVNIIILISSISIDLLLFDKKLLNKILIKFCKISCPSRGKNGNTFKQIKPFENNTKYLEKKLRQNIKIYQQVWDIIICLNHCLKL